MSEDLILLAVFLATSVVVSGVSVPLMLKLIGPNPWYGWRTPSTLRDPDVWYPVNQVTGVWLFVTGQSTAAAAVFTYLAQFDIEVGPWITVGVLGIGIVLAVVHGNIVIRKTKRE